MLVSLNVKKQDKTEFTLMKIRLENDLGKELTQADFFNILLTEYKKAKK